MFKELGLFDLFERDVNTDLLALTNTAKRISGNKDILISYLRNDYAAFTDCRIIYIPQKYKEDIKGSQGLVAHEAGHVGYGSFELNFAKLVAVVSKKFDLPSGFVRQLVNVVEDVRINAINDKKFPGFYRNLRNLELTLIPIIKSRIVKLKDIVTYIYLFMEDFEGFLTIPNLGPFKISISDWNSVVNIKKFIIKFRTPNVTLLSVYKLCNILKKYFPKKIERKVNQFPQVRGVPGSSGSSSGGGSRSYPIPMVPEEGEEDMESEIEDGEIYYNYEDNPKQGNPMEDFDLLTRWNESQQFENNTFDKLTKEKTELQEYSEDLIKNLEEYDLSTKDLEKIEEDLANFRENGTYYGSQSEEMSYEKDIDEFTRSWNETHDKNEINSDQVKEFLQEIEKNQDLLNNHFESREALEELKKNLREKFDDLNLEDGVLDDLISDIQELKQKEDFLRSNNGSLDYGSNLENLSKELNKTFENCDISCEDLKDIFMELDEIKNNGLSEGDPKTDLDLFEERLCEKLGVDKLNSKQLETIFKQLELFDEKDEKIDIEELLNDKRHRFKVEVLKKIADNLKKAEEEMDRRLKTLELGMRVLKIGGDFKDRKVIETTIDKENMIPVDLTLAQMKINYDNQIKKIKRVFAELKNQRDYDSFQKRGRLNSKLIKAVTSDYRYKQCFTKKTVERELRLLIIVDISGSMKGVKMKAAKIALVLLCEALEYLANTRIVLFTGKHDALNILVKNFDEPLNPKKMDKFGSHANDCQNLDGISIKHEANKLQKDDFIIVISDGQPAGDGNYGLNEAMNDIHDVRKRFKVYAFSIDAKGEYLDKLYQKDWILTNSQDEQDLGQKMVKLCQLIVKEFFN